MIRSGSKSRVGRRHAIVAALSVGAFAVSACGSKSAGSTDTSKSAKGGTETVNVAFNGLLSGPNATPASKYTPLSIQAAIDEINAAGGVKHGNKTYKFKLTTLDDRTNAQVSASNATKLVRDQGIKFIMGPNNANAAAVAELLNRLGALNFSSVTAITADAGTPKAPRLFGTAPTADYSSKVLNSAIKKWFPNAKRMAFIGPDDPVFQGLAARYETSEKQAGLTTKQFLYPPGTTDLSSVATKLAAFKPDVVFSGYQAEVINQLKAMNAAGVPKSVGVFGIGAAPTPQDIGGRPYVYYQNFTPIDPVGQPNEPHTARYIADMKKLDPAVKPEQLVLAPIYYNSMLALAAAVGKTGSTDPEVIAKALPGLEFKGLTGTKIAYDAKHLLDFPLPITILHPDGKRETVTYTDKGPVAG